MDRWVEISFDCLPLRSVGRLDAPLDASPKFQEFCQRVKACIEKHGAHNTYYLYNAACIYRLTNSPEVGMIEFAFDGVAITDAADQKTLRCDLDVRLARETCPWLTEPIVAWFAATVQHSVAAEFDRFIAAGDLNQAKERMEKIQAKVEEQGGYLGMYL
jgi:hypothetical protein